MTKLQVVLALYICLSTLRPTRASICKTYCDSDKTGEGTVPCTKKITQQRVKYTRCGLFWASRCRKGTYLVYTTVTKCCSKTCKVNGGWGVWSSWSMSQYCSRTCGRGSKSHTRARHCNNPTPKHGGNNCQGHKWDSIVYSCNTIECPVDGVWSVWGSWSFDGQCSVTCGSGNINKFRTRSCNNPRPKNGGKPCVGDELKRKKSTCNKGSCPVNGNWSSWGSWKQYGKCSVSCGNGMQKHVRIRKCDHPAPSHGGSDCHGNGRELSLKKCFLKVCPIEDHPLCKEKKCSRYGDCGCAFGFFGNGFNCKGSRGKRFLVLFPETVPNLPSEVETNRSSEIYIASLVDSKVTLQSSNKYLSGSSYSKGSWVSKGATTLTIPIQMRTVDFKKENKAIILESSEPVSVVNLNHDGFSSDSSLILPIESLGTKYVVGSTEPYSARFESFKSQVAIAAVQNNTTVSITFKLKSKGSIHFLQKNYKSGDKVDLNLNKYDSFQFSHGTDLTGTFIESSKPIAVFSGNRCNKLQRFGFCSHLIEQLPPIDKLDNQFIVPPSLKRSGTKVRIISAKKTKITFRVNYGKREHVMEPGTSHDAEMFGDHSVYIHADGPIMVLSFAVQMGRRGKGDPYMSVVPGLNQYLSQYQIVVPSGYNQNYLSIIVKAESKYKLRIDGKTLSDDSVLSERAVLAGREKYLSLVVEVRRGGHKVETLDNSRFGLMVHGNSSGDGYGFAANIINVS